MNTPYLSPVRWNHIDDSGFSSAGCWKEGPKLEQGMSGLFMVDCMNEIVQWFVGV
jgi:hypothetical protein